MKSNKASEFDIGAFNAALDALHRAIDDVSNWQIQTDGKVTLARLNLPIEWPPTLKLQKKRGRKKGKTK